MARTAKQQMQAAIDFEALFARLPEPYILFKADDPDFTFVAVNDAHLKLTGKKRSDIIGKAFFTVFPDVSEEFKRTGVSQLVESLRRVIHSKQPEALEDFRYDIPDKNGVYHEKYWRPVHYPVFDAGGTVTHLLQTSIDVTKERQAAQNLHSVESRLEAALSIGQVGSWAWDLASDRIIADKNLAGLFGIKAKAAADGLPLATFTNSIHPKDRQRVSKAIGAAVRQAGRFEEEYRTVMANGTIRWVIARGKVETGADGKPANFPGVIVDITERKLAEASYRQQLDLTNTITKSLGEGVFAVDQAGKVTFMNPAAERLLGWSEPEVLGRVMHDLIHFQHADGRQLTRDECLLFGSLQTGKAISRDDDTFTRKDGSTFAVSYTVVPIKQGRQVVGAVQSFNDISERRQAEINLRFLAEASKVVAASLDYKKTLRAIARLAVPDIADWCAIDLLEGHDIQQIAVTHRDAGKVAWAKAERAKRPPQIDDAQGVPNVIRTGKAEFYPHVSDDMLRATAKNKAQLKRLQNLSFRSVIIVPLKHQKQSIGAITFVITEQTRHFTKADLETAQELANRASLAITNSQLYRTARNELLERESLEVQLREVNEELEQRVSRRTAQLQATNAQLERSNQELQDFAYVASHDLQEPLRKIQAFSNLLSNEYAGQLGDGKDYVERMQKAAHRMSVLIEDLLSFSRVTTKANPFSEVDLEQIAHEVIEDLETRISDTGATVTVQPLPKLRADPLQIRQLLQNLIGNALKFAREGQPPVVTVSAELRPSENGTIQLCQLRVADNGIGFDEKYLDRIFAVFQRLHGREQYQGTGIGLAICRKIAERHGGNITAESQPDRGATFIVNLPTTPKEGT